jgi:uncharacterized protein (DUF1778 family)
MHDAEINLRAKPEQRDPLDQVQFRLDDQRFKDFVRQLDASPSGNEGLARLMAVKAPWGAPARPAPADSR